MQMLATLGARADSRYLGASVSVVFPKQKSPVSGLLIYGQESCYSGSSGK